MVEQLETYGGNEDDGGGGELSSSLSTVVTGTLKFVLPRHSLFTFLPLFIRDVLFISLVYEV